MATSDSEDFESADEWEEGDSAEGSADVGEKGVADGQSRLLGSEKGDGQVEILSKTLEKKVSLSGDQVPSTTKCLPEVIKKPFEPENSSKNDCFSVAAASEALVESDGWDIDDDLIVDDPVEEELKEDNQNVEGHATENVKHTAEEKSRDIDCGTIEKLKEDSWKKSKESGDFVKKEPENISVSNDVGNVGKSKGSFDSVLNKLSASVEKEQQNSSSGGWGGWGVSFLSSATESMTTLTSQVSSGLTSVLETGLGVPNPEELVKQEAELEKKREEVRSHERETHLESETVEASEGGIFGFGRVISGVSSITRLVETAGNKVVSGGLDTLETIGKKTMEVLQEGDPGLRKKRALFQEKINLSQVLRDAKEKAEMEDIELKDKEEARKTHFESLFDDHHGLVHLEALEMLTKQCAVKLESALLNTPSAVLGDLQRDVSHIKELCQLPEEDEVEEELDSQSVRARLAMLGKGLDVPVGSEKLVKTWDETQQWLEECAVKQKSADAESPPPSAREVHQKAIGSLARMTAESVELFHKAAELLLVQEKRNPRKEATAFLEITSALTSQVSASAALFSECLNECSENKSDSETVKSHITNVFLEAANSSSYIQEAFQLLVPVLQIGVTSS